MKITCRICKKITQWEDNPYRPFCSERCKMTDLGTWASEGYRIAGKKEEEEDESDYADEDKEEQ